MSQEHKKLFLMRSLFTREHRAVKLKSSNAPQKVMENEAALVFKARGQMLAEGITEDEYKKFRDEYWFYHEAKAVESEMNLLCIERMRQYQAMEKKNRGLVPEAFNCSHYKGECGPFCPHYLKSSAEQEMNFSHMCDIDTGESFPIDALEDDVNEMFDEMLDE